MAVKYPAVVSRRLDGRYWNSVFACSQCFSFESILLSDISDVTYRNIFPLVLRYLLFKFACWLHYAILTAFFGTSQLFCSVFQLTGFKGVLFYFSSSCDYQVLCWVFFLVGYSSVSFSLFSTDRQHTFILLVDIVLCTPLCILFFLASASTVSAILPFHFRNPARITQGKMCGAEGLPSMNRSEQKCKVCALAESSGEEGLVLLHPEYLDGALMTAAGYFHESKTCPFRFYTGCGQHFKLCKKHNLKSQ